MRYCTEIDVEGFIVATYVLTVDQIANFEGTLLADVYPPSGIDTLFKAKWVNEKWVEGASQQEIDDYNTNKPMPQPSELEILRQQVDLLQSENEGLVATMEFLLLEVIPNITGE